MAHYRRSYKLDLITPHGRVDTWDVYSAVFPAIDGLIGILGGRAPVVTLMGAGPLSAETTDGRRVLYFVAGGFANMLDDVLTVLAEQCTLADKLTRDQARADLEAARKLPGGDRRNAELAVAKAKLALAERPAAPSAAPAPAAG